MRIYMWLICDVSNAGVCVCLPICKFWYRFDGFGRCVVSHCVSVRRPPADNKTRCATIAGHNLGFEYAGFPVGLGLAFLPSKATLDRFVSLVSHNKVHQFTQLAHFVCHTPS